MDFDPFKDQRVEPKEKRKEIEPEILREPEWEEGRPTEPKKIQKTEPDPAKKKAFLFAIILAIIATLSGVFFLFTSMGSRDSSKDTLPEKEGVNPEIENMLPPSSPSGELSDPEKTQNSTENSSAPSQIKSTPVPPSSHIPPTQQTETKPSAEEQALIKLQQQYLSQLEKLIYGTTKTGQDLSKLEPLVTVSPLAGKITIRSVARPNSDDPKDEYVVLSAGKNLPENFQITGLRLRSLSSGQEITIGEGVYLPYSNQINYKSPINIGPGTTVYVITGSSPVGYSFRPNKCSGYWSQFQKFTPAIRLSCPKIIYAQPAELPLLLNDDCFNYVNKMSVCKIHVDKSTNSEIMAKDPYYQLSPQCRQFINNTSGYNNCVNLYKGDADFYASEWRVYLNRSSIVWKKKREIIQLVDANNKVIAQYSY